MMQGPSGEQYVTIIQDGQTYAIPASDYAAMMAQQGLEVVEPQDNEARVGGDQPEHTVLPAVTTQASSHLTESLTLPTTPMPPTIPHLTPCPPPTLAQVSNQVVNSPIIKTEPRTAEVGETDVGKTGGGGGGDVRWMSATTPAAGSRSVKQEPRKRQISPTMQ